MLESPKRKKEIAISFGASLKNRIGLLVKSKTLDTRKIREI